MRHIWKVPEDVEWQPCTHLATKQWYAILREDTSVETPHGTMTGRTGDVLMMGLNEQLYVLTRKSFEDAYQA